MFLSLHRNDNRLLWMKRADGIRRRHHLAFLADKNNLGDRDTVGSVGSLDRGWKNVQASSVLFCNKASWSSLLLEFHRTRRETIESDE